MAFLQAVSRRKFLGTAAAAVAANAVQACARPLAASIGPALRRGISIHNALNWPAMDAPGRYAPRPFGKAADLLCRPALGQLRAAGFDFVRLSINPGILFDAASDRRVDLIGEVRSWASRVLDAGMSVVFDLHAISRDEQQRRDYFASGNTAADEGLARLLEDMARGIGDMPKDRTALELWNEPNIAPERAVAWDRFQRELHRRVRNVAPDLTLVLTGVNGWLDGLTQVAAGAYRDPNLYFTFHFYDPTPFTHQGAYNPADPADPTRLFEQVPYPLSAGQADEVVGQARRRLAESRASLSAEQRGRADSYVESRLRYLIQRGNAGHIRNAFASVSRWALLNGIPAERVLLGEFGVMRPGVDPASRARWLQDVRITAEQARFGWCLWSYDNTKYMSLITDDRNHQLDPGVLEALGLRKQIGSASVVTC